jgi:hypothetical protein
MKTRLLVIALIGFLVVVALSGCAITGIRYNAKGEVVEKIKIKGWGAKKATFENGSSIEKEEPIKTPDLMPITK